MINTPQLEPYYEELTNLGYIPLDYSEKHYVFRKNSHIIKLAKSRYNTIANDDSFGIEKAAHDILCAAGLPAAEVEKIFERNAFLADFAVLQEKYYEGQIYYSKDVDSSLLMQAWDIIQAATTITKNTYGFLQADGTTSNATWRSFLQDVANNSKTDRDFLLSRIAHITEPKYSSFIFTDINIANFIFENKKLKIAIDIERPIFGDKKFIYGVAKSRNPNFFNLIKNTIDFSMELVDYYSVVYKHIFDSL